MSGLEALQSRVGTGGSPPPPPPPPPTSSFNEESFQSGIRATEWFSEFKKRHGEEPDLRAPSDDPSKGPNYDYRKAWAEGLRPTRSEYDGGQYHWSSSTGSGEMLKTPNHPTAWKEYFMREHGKDPDSLSAADVKKMRGSKY